MRTPIVVGEGAAATIVICGGKNRGGSYALIIGRRATGSRAMSACKKTLTRAPSRVAVSTFLERPRICDDAEDQVRRGRDAFFGNEEMQLACVRRPKTGQQSLSRDDVLNEVDVPVGNDPPRCLIWAAYVPYGFRCSSKRDVR